MSNGSGSGAGGVVSPWSCFNCRRRKARCTRRNPCAQCSRSGLECSFPSTGRMPTRQHDPDAASTVPTRKRMDLLSRLKHLEGVVAQLSSSLGDGPSMLPPSGGAGNEKCFSKSAATANTDMDVSSKDSIYQLRRDFGKIHINDTNNMYVGNNFWDTLQCEIQKFRLAFEEESLPPAQGPEEDAPEWLKTGVTFSPARGSRDKEVEHCLPPQIGFIWQAYIENIDPLVKILHIPTMSQVIQESAGKQDELPINLRCLLHAICLAAVTSLDEQDVVEHLGSSKADVLWGYIRSTEQALSDAGIVDTLDVRVLQAFLLYLETVGHYYGLRSIWVMNGLLVRTAVSMGLHRDGSTFSNISYFCTEIRRRLWWHICFLDYRVGQCDVPEMSISDSSFDTKEPTNVNDEDIYPLMDHEPTPREGLTDVSFSLLNCVLRRQSKQISYLVSIIVGKTDGLAEAQSKALQGLRQAGETIRNEILQSSEPKKPVHQFIGFMAEMVLQQYTIVIKHLNIFGQLAPTENEPPLQESFLASMACLENQNAWKTHPSTRQWAWILQTFHQWHAIGIILVHLRTQPWGPTCERAWNLALRALDEVPPAIKKRNPMGQSLWDMLAAAREHRKEELQRLRQNPTLLGNLQQFSEIHEPFSPIDGPSTGTVSFDTSVVAERLFLETAVSLGESGTGGVLYQPVSQSSIEHDSSALEWLASDQMCNPFTAQTGILSELGDAAVANGEQLCLGRPNAGDTTGGRSPGCSDGPFMDAPVLCRDIFGDSEGKGNSEASCKSIDPDGLIALFNRDQGDVFSSLSG